MSGIKDYSLTPASNTSINSIDISEGCPPSSVNNAIRQEMADTRSFYESGGFVVWGHTCTYASGTSFTVSGDVTAVYVANRRLRAVGSSTGTIYGKVASSSYSAPNTTVTVTWDSGSLSNESLTVSVGWVSPTGSPVYVASGVSGPGSSTNGYVPQWSGTGGDALSTGLAVGTGANNLLQLDGSSKLPAVDGSQLTNLPGGDMVAVTVVTSSSDISLSTVPTQANVGSSFSMTIPTSGIIGLSITGRLLNDASAATRKLILGIRIGSTNYWPSANINGTTMYIPCIVTPAVSSAYSEFSSAGGDGTAADAASGINPNNEVQLGIEALSIPTGAQTVQVVAALAQSGGNATLKGTTTPTRVYVSTLGF